MLNCDPVDRGSESVAEPSTIPRTLGPEVSKSVALTVFVIVVPAALVAAITGIVSVPGVGATPGGLAADVEHSTCCPVTEQLQSVPLGVPLILRLGSNVSLKLRDSKTLLAAAVTLIRSCAGMPTDSGPPVVVLPITW
jgi:hypothetical protein